MKYEEILEVLAPCCSNCRKCIFYSNGEILNHSINLKELLGSFDNYAERFSMFLPVFKKFYLFLKNIHNLKNCSNFLHTQIVRAVVIKHVLYIQIVVSLIAIRRKKLTFVFNVMSSHVKKPILILI
jgi:hypothetical protein